MKEVLISSPASAVSAEFSGQSNRPSFAGLLWAEWLKISRQWQTWALFVLQACFLGGFYLIELTLSRSNLKLLLRSDPLVYAYRLVHGLDCVRVFGGICLIIVAARCVGLEYQLGTVRVLLARGVGRVQLLLAKLVTLFLVATLLLLIDLLLAVLSSTLMTLVVVGNLQVFTDVGPAFWQNVGLTVLTVAVSMVVSILMAVAMAVVGRSQTFGLSAAVAYFPIDNALVLLLLLGEYLTNSQFWLDLTAYLLGPNLNVMPQVVTADHVAHIGVAPLNMHLVDTNHVFLLTLVYALIFLVVSLMLTWRRDVLE